MSLRKPLVLNNGVWEQLQSGDTLDAATIAKDVVIVTNGAATAITICQAVYISGENQVQLAQANAAGTTKVCGLVATASITSSGTGSIQTDGILNATTAQWDAVTGDTGGLTPGATYYLDAASPGNITKSPDSSSGNFIMKVGMAFSSTDLEIDISDPIRL